jgi:hypothetical protein
MWRRILLFSVCIGIGVTTIAAPSKSIANKRFVFHEQTGDDVTQYEIRVRPYGEGYRIYGSFNDRDTFVECDASLAHQRLEIDRKAQEHLITYQREGKTITGAIGDETITKKMSDDPWYQMLEISKKFITSKGDLGKFWVVSDQMGEHTKEPGFSAIKLQARGEGTETIQHQGQDVETMKILVRLTGLRSAFWQAEYWYRPSDGVLLRYEAVRGGPGTPKTIITLLEEEDLPAQ